MFSSSANKPSRLLFSLAGKLALLYALTTFSTLLLASGLFYWSLLEHLEKEHHNLLTNKIEKVKKHFNAWPFVELSIHELINEHHHHGPAGHSSAIHPGLPHHVFIRILDEQGTLELESKSQHPLFNDLNFSEITSAEGNRSTQISKQQLPGKQQFLLGSAWAVINDEHNTKHIIQAALVLNPDDALLTEYQHTLVGVLVVGVLLSAWGGFWITRRGLRPLREMTHTIRGINISQLNERVDSTQWPKELALLASAFDAMLSRLDQSFIQLSQFSADLAHELRTPVNNLMGEAEVALSRERDAEEYRQILGSNIEECNRLARMIDELLFLARAENPKTSIKPCHLQLNLEFKKMLEFYENIALDKQISLKSDSSTREIFADPGLLRRVLSNLLSNALRYTQAHGTVLLTAEQNSDNGVKIMVKDTGIGIPADQLPNIFDRFFRVDKARYRDTQGTGLGLAIVQSIMELHGGKIHVSSQPIVGTQVELIFPPAPS